MKQVLESAGMNVYANSELVNKMFDRPILSKYGAKKEIIMKGVLINKKVKKRTTVFFCHFSTGVCSPKD